MSELLLNPRAAGSRAREDLCIKHQYQYHHLSDTEAQDKHTVRESVMLIFKSAEGEKHTNCGCTDVCRREFGSVIYIQMDKYTYGAEVQRFSLEGN